MSVRWSPGAESALGPDRRGGPGRVVPWRDPADTPRVVTSRRPLWTWAVVGAVGATGLAVFGTGVGATPRGAVWWFSLPHGSRWALGVPFYVSVCLLVAAWVGVGVWAGAGRLTMRQAWLLLSAWGLPLALGPPLFSRDLYSYMAQGLIAHRGLNPYAVGPSVLGPGPVLDSVASVWRHAPAPYGPLFVTATRSVAAVFGTSITAEVLALRSLELAGVALLMVCLPRLARNLGADPGMALWLGVLSPLALFSFIASGHNDALMVGLLVAGLTLATEKRPTAALLLCALAMTVKVPAAAGVAFVGLGWLRSTKGRERRRAAAACVAVPVATVVGVTWATGLPWTWLGSTPSGCRPNSVSFPPPRWLSAACSGTCSLSSVSTSVGPPPSTSPTGWPPPPPSSWWCGWLSMSGGSPRSVSSASPLSSWCWPVPPSGPGTSCGAWPSWPPLPPSGPPWWRGPPPWPCWWWDRVAARFCWGTPIWWWWGRAWWASSGS